MAQIRLIHWNADEAKECAKLLKDAGYKVDLSPLTNPDVLKKMKRIPPDLFAIDLSRLPSHGREVALSLRQSRSTRHVPLVFVEGEGEQLQRIRALLPDAVFTTWRRIRNGIRTALAHPPSQPIVQSVLAGYSGTPLPKKLGMKEGSVVVLIEAPEDFEHTLGDLPKGAKLSRNPRGKRDISLWFVRSARELEKGFGRIARDVSEGKLWIIWAKKASGIQSDVSERLVQKTGLAAGLVDYKICAVDQTWSGLLFTRRKNKVRGTTGSR